jgi:tetratricopeptide (TPR) repeat protein
MDVMTSLKDVVLYYSDCKNGDGIKLAEEFKIRSYPTFMLIDGNRQPIARWVGYKKDYFIETIAEMMADLSPVQVKIERFETERNLADGLALAKYYAASNDYKQAVDYYSEIQKHDEAADYSYSIFDNISKGVSRKIFTYNDAADAAEKVFAGDNTKDIVFTASRMSSLARWSKKTDEMAKYLDRGIAVDVTEDNEQVNYTLTSLKIDYNLYVTGDSAQAVELKKSTFDKGWTENANSLNSFAWWCFENLVNLEEAEELSRKAVALSEPGSDRAMILDTVARICKARGKLDEAIEQMKQAVADDPNNSDYSKALAEFESEKGEG